MIIQSSEVSMSAEHEKREYRRISREMAAGSEGTLFDLQFEEASERMQQQSLSFSAVFAQWFGGAPENNAEGDSDQAANSILVMTDEGYKFKTEEQRQKDHAEDYAITKAKLLQSLLKAINPDNPALTNIDTVNLPEEGDYTHTGGDDLPTLTPITVDVTFKMTESIEEYECSEFSSCGVVKTADGREIEFGMDLKMERSYKETRSYEVTEAVTFKDPLIVNFDGTHAELSDNKFSFDLDADGEEELISYLINDGAMLALDKNKDGIINDGSELFGAQSGNGFADLAQYDEDGNGYIDEADAIFADLKLWTKTEDKDQLESLAERGVGAIYLGSTETPFDLKGEDNQQNGRVRASGFYLTEAGGVGNIQQIDMVV